MQKTPCHDDDQTCVVDRRCTGNNNIQPCNWNAIKTPGYVPPVIQYLKTPPAFEPPVWETDGKGRAVPTWLTYYNADVMPHVVEGFGEDLHMPTLNVKNVLILAFVVYLVYCIMKHENRMM